MMEQQPIPYWRFLPLAAAMVVTIAATQPAMLGGGYLHVLKWPVFVLAFAAVAWVIAGGVAPGGSASRWARVVTYGCLWAALGAALWRFCADFVPVAWGTIRLSNWPLLDLLKAPGAVVRTVAANPEAAAARLLPVLPLVMLIAGTRRALFTEPLAPMRQRARAARLRRRPGWLDRKEVTRMTTARTGVPLGLYGSRIARYRPSPGQFLGGHHMVIAGTRAGKGVACVLPAIVDHDGPVVVIDVKGENMAVCRRHRTSLGRRQVVLNPFGLIDGKTSRINPMTYLRPGPTLQRDIAVLADGLVIEIHGDDRWISDAARRLVEAALELLVTMEPREQWSLAALSNLVQSPGRLGTFAKWQQAGDLCGGRIAKAGASIMSMGSKEQGMIFEHLDASLDWLKYDQMRQLTAPGGHSFSYADLLAGKQDVYICIPQDMTKTLGGFMRVVLNTVLGAVTRQDGKTRVAQKILCVMDEFTRLGRMEKVMEIATIAAGGGVEAVFIVQDLATHESVYGPLDTKTLLGSCATTRIFGLGSGDDKTAKWAEGTMPMYTMKKKNRSRGSDGRMTFTDVEQKEKLLSAAELLELPPTVMLCRIRSNPGVLLDQIISHQHPAYRKRLDPNPVVRA